MNTDARLHGPLQGGGEMGALMRAFDWSTTPVGPIESWPQSLKTAVSIVLSSRHPMWIWWGPELVQFYNDGYRPSLGQHMHPQALGGRGRETWASIWHIIGPDIERVMREGAECWYEDALVPFDRSGFLEEIYFTYGYSPIRDESGGVGGTLVVCTETTRHVISQRRLRTLALLAARSTGAASEAELWKRITAVLAGSAHDLPFSVIYTCDGDCLVSTRTASTGLPESSWAAPDEIRLDAIGASDAAWPLARAIDRRDPLEDTRQIAAHGALPGGPWPEPTERALIVAIPRAGHERPAGFLVAGVSPRLALDETYREFVGLVAGQIGSALTDVRALEEERRRAAMLDELNRAKTSFFSNVSHEFRTPLTLLLGPAEEAARTPGGTLAGHDLDIVHRNAQRLLKLVNTLLDFSRIEAGRSRASFEPTDLAAITTDLASAFRSATERAGLTLAVHCAPLPEPVYVDRDMWEKIVLNLLSNAFKFTLNGRIAVSLAWQATHVELTVSDTGVGIAPADLPHVFDRFHRGERTQARSQEGSGIGLALVRELVGMHGGTVSVASQLNHGSTFTVVIPAGFSHLPPDQVSDGRGAASSGSGVTPFVQEALRWLPETSGRDTESAAPAGVDASSARIIVADDNGDMRDYMRRLLGDRWTVDAVADGAAALSAAQANRPDVVVADVMMPGLDGFQLIDALRADERTRSVPVILVSARAGEEARVQGLQAGADDYLVKPFAARELVARVQTQILRAKLRSVEEAQALRIASIFEHAPVGVAILRGPAHVFEFANDVYRAMTGNRRIEGRPIREALPELSGQMLYELLDGVFTSGEPYVGRSQRVMLDRGAGEPVETFFDFVYQPLRDGGEVTGIAVVCFEVTELTRARRDAESASRAKDEFLAMLGHELRNPLAPILTALQLMNLRGLTGADRERRIIERQVKHVVRLVDDLLDVSRITRGRVQLRRERLALADVIAKAVEMVSPAIEERHHTLHTEIAVGLEVDGDAARLAQVLSNLLNNAAKYTDPNGSIRVVAERTAAGIEVRVSDSGTGIAPEMLPHVFDLFVQERQDPERARGGLGIGLAIVRSLVEAHGGSVAVASAGKGQGSTFTVRLPVPATAAAAVPEAPSTAAPGAIVTGRTQRILLVDDNHDAASLLAETLRVLGHEVFVAHDGPEALLALREFQPDVALLDLGLPVMDGFELADQLRADPRCSDTTLIAITGYSQEIDRRRTAAHGFAAHLAKPIDVHHLDVLLRTPSQSEL